MRKLLNSLGTFEFTLRILAALSRRTKGPWTQQLTSGLAYLNVKVNGHKPKGSVEGLAKSWLKMMPPNQQELFRVTHIEDDTAYAEIHLHCPLRGTGDGEACHKLMHYDRSLMRSVGGSLEVLNSQATSGKSFCQLAIRKTQK